MIQKINTQTELILKFLNREFKDDHPSIFIYCRGYQVRSKDTSKRNILKYIKVIFQPMSDSDLLEVIEEFLNDKREKYKKGLIKIKSLY